MSTPVAISTAFHGTAIHSTSINEITVFENVLLVVGRGGKICFLEENVSREEVTNRLTKISSPESQLLHVTYLPRGKFLIPGFVDTHNHAPQWAQRGLGRGMPILDWLNGLTFRNEAKFEDWEYARKIYSRCVDGFIKQGITTVSYYGSLHGEATKVLAEICFNKGQRALIGKCNMNRNGGIDYVDASAAESLRVTEDCIDHIRKLDPTGGLIKPVLTPRFAICCTDELLQGLGNIAKSNPGIAIQTHFNEATTEIDTTLSLFPKFNNETDLYSHYNLLGPGTILAHCCCSAPNKAATADSSASATMDHYEFTQLKALDVGIAHCPISNTTVGTSTYAAAPIRSLLRDYHFTKIGLGTDSGGGFSSSILDAMRHAFIVSNAREMLTDGADPKLSVEECFYLATVGGAKVCGLGDKIGSFEVGKEFDALVISTMDDEGEALGVMTMLEDEDSTRTIFEKFLVSGDDRNIEQVYVRDRPIKK